MENFLEGETSFRVSENYTGQVGFESHLSEWWVLSKFCFQLWIYMIMRFLFSDAAQHAMYIDQNWLLWQKKNKQNKKQWCNKLYFIPMRFLFFWNTWYSPHHVRSVTWMKLVKWNTKVWMFLENKHFDQHKKMMDHQTPQIIFEYISKHQELFQLFNNMTWVCSGYVGQTWRCLEMWQNTTSIVWYIFSKNI